MIAGRALSIADRSAAAASVHMAAGNRTDGWGANGAGAVLPAPAAEAQPPPPPMEEPQEAEPRHVLETSRVDAVQFSQRKQALDAQLQHSRELLAAAKALGTGVRPLAAAEAHAPAMAQDELATSVQHDDATRPNSSFAQSYSHPQPQVEPDPEPEPEPQLIAGTPPALKTRRSPMRTDSAASDWRAEFLRELPHPQPSGLCSSHQQRMPAHVTLRSARDRFHAVNGDITRHMVVVRFGDYRCS